MLAEWFARTFERKANTDNNTEIKMPFLQFKISQAQQEAIEVILRKNGWDHETLLRQAFLALSEKHNRAQMLEDREKAFRDAPPDACVPCSFPEETRVFGPPVGMTEDEVYSLCASEVNWDNQKAVVTCWKPTKEGLEEINKTGRIWVATMGEGLVPMCVLASSPFEHEWCTLRKTPIG